MRVYEIREGSKQPKVEPFKILSISKVDKVKAFIARFEGSSISRVITVMVTKTRSS
jgi:hypothetical protein